MISVLSFGYLYWSSIFHNPDLKWNIVQQCTSETMVLIISWLGFHGSWVHGWDHGFHGLCIQCILYSSYERKCEKCRWVRVKRAWATFPWVRGIGLQGRISFFFWSRFLFDEGDKYDDDDDDGDYDGNNYDGNNPFCFICSLLSVEHSVWQIIIF